MYIYTPNVVHIFKVKFTYTKKNFPKFTLTQKVYFHFNPDLIENQKWNYMDPKPEI